jgi:protein-histidine pros-kinase
MGLRLKFNIVLVLVFFLGFVVAGWISYELLQRNARGEIVRNARVMMEAALAIRGFTSKEVRPQLEPLMATTFLPQSVPAYAATETMGALRKNYPDYGYKEATLNPTNPRNRATDWEVDIVTAFKNHRDKREIVGERDTPTGRSMFVARPIHVEPGCLVCHSTPAVAPKSMVALYGEVNGFGWKLNDVIGAQVVSVPTALPIHNANRAFVTFMGSLAAVFLFVFIALNVMLNSMIVRPIRDMARAADEVSTGNFDLPEFQAKAQDEIGVLGASFNRMRRSLEKAMKMLEG